MKKFTVENESVITGESLVEKTAYISKTGGKKIFIAAVLPKGAEGDRLPTVILSHGFGGQYSDELPKARAIAAAGYACFCVDFGGINPDSKTDGIMEDTTLDTEKGELLSLMEFAAECDFCDKNRLYLYGESMGGLVSVLAAEERLKDIKAVALIYPALSVPTDYHNGGGLAPWPKFRKNALGYYGKEKEIFARCSMPVLIQHGTADKLVDISYSRRAVKAFPHARLIELEGAGHGVNMPWEQVVNSAIRFFEEIGG